MFYSSDYWVKSSFYLTNCFVDWHHFGRNFFSDFWHKVMGFWLFAKWNQFICNEEEVNSRNCLNKRFELNWFAAPLGVIHYYSNGIRFIFTTFCKIRNFVEDRQTTRTTRMLPMSRDWRGANTMRTTTVAPNNNKTLLWWWRHIWDCAFSPEQPKP